MAALTSTFDARSAEYQSLDAITQTVSHYLSLQPAPSGTTRTSIDVSRPDRRLALAACADALEVTLPGGGRALGNVTATVRCKAPRPWTLGVPASVMHFGPMLIAARPLARGQVIGSSDYTTVDMALTPIGPGYFTTAADIVGRVVKYPLAAGKALGPANLAAPQLVKRGAEVSLLVESGALRIRMKGSALSDGALGDTVRVRNSGSNRIVQGVVIDTNTLRVPL